MLHTAHHKVGTVYHTAVANLDSSLWVSYGRFIANIYLIIIVKVLLFVVTVLGFQVRQDKRKMGIAVLLILPCNKHLPILLHKSIIGISLSINRHHNARVCHSFSIKLIQIAELTFLFQNKRFHKEQNVLIIRIVF